MEKNTGRNTAFLRRGVSVRQLNILLAGITLAISVLLLFATYRARVGYVELRGYTDNYIRWQRDAYDLQLASDFLTEQVRSFVETGERYYLEAYFKEATVTRRREKALENLETYLGETEAYTALEAAMRQSVLLMEREYYAMRLVVEAKGYALFEFPKEIIDVDLHSGDAHMAPESQMDLARSMVFDQIYASRKQSIAENMDACLTQLTAEVERRQVTTADRLELLLHRQRLLIIFLIVVTVLTMLLTLLLVISPLLRAVVFIRGQQPIPVKGSYEFRFLAKTYNLMYAASREKQEQLAYEATHDKLTGAYNRAGYDFLLQNVDIGTTALLVVDLDKFKSINDTYGHDAGDRVLMRVADCLRGSFRSQDYICRVGGDEFVVLLVRADTASPEMLTGKIGQVNGALLDPREEGLPQASVSCGAAFGREGEDGDALFRRADAAMYEVKERGGCGCRVAE